TSGTGNLTGTPVSSAGVSWALAEVKLTAAAGPLAGQTWKGQLTRGTTVETFSYTALSRDTLTTVAPSLAPPLDPSPPYHSAIKYETATFTTAWPTDAAHAPVNGRGYFITPVNNNFLVTESDQVDVLNVYNQASVSDDVGTLTGSRITGFGMGPDTVIAGKP